MCERLGEQASLTRALPQSCTMLVRRISLGPHLVLTLAFSRFADLHGTVHSRSTMSGLGIEI
jgi:hypothetical protein